MANCPDPNGLARLKPDPTGASLSPTADSAQLTCSAEDRDAALRAAAQTAHRETAPSGAESLQVRTLDITLAVKGENSTSIIRARADREDLAEHNTDLATWLTLFREQPLEALKQLTNIVKQEINEAIEAVKIAATSAWDSASSTCRNVYASYIAPVFDELSAKLSILSALAQRLPVRRTQANSTQSNEEASPVVDESKAALFTPAAANVMTALEFLERSHPTFTARAIERLKEWFEFEAAALAAAEAEEKKEAEERKREEAEGIETRKEVAYVELLCTDSIALLTEIQALVAESGGPFELDLRTIDILQIAAKHRLMNLKDEKGDSAVRRAA